ncbi:unnamed protein product [Paramecium sonneborni]|uniref:Uncharacterized protein n=1 Tax=Paramecium sonneborni TaxID=65129 RepID=A0A8S1PKL9_9CILI|nr:unnamed protein product [Paramecium sonneborni]
MLKSILRVSYKIGINSQLQQLPIYSSALQALFQNEYGQAQEYLQQLKQQVENLQDPNATQEVLDLFVQLYKQTKNYKDLISIQEEQFFTYLSMNSIYNEDNSESLKELFRSYIEFDPKRGQAMLQFLQEKVDEIIPLGFQKEFFTYGGTLELLNKNYENSQKLFSSAQDSGTKGNLAGMCLNNQVILSELNLDGEIQKLKGDFNAFCQQNIKNLLDAIIAFELNSVEENKKELYYLYKLIEQTELYIDKKEINAIINGTQIINPNSYAVILNLIDLLINHQYPDKATAWIKVIFKNKTQNPNMNIKSFGRSLLQYAKISMIDNKINQAETILLDFLNSQQPRLSFLQMMGLTQYSLLLKTENRQYEADQYEKQALNISSKLSPTSYIREQIILL